MAPFGVDIPSIPAGLSPSGLSPSGLAASALSASGLAAPTAQQAQKADTRPAWKQALKPASFRGVPFFVETDETETGRRVATHEFPGRDMPYTEDLGRKARSVTVEAYVLGADYMQKRDALLAACEAEGPAPLVTPWMPEVRVVCTGCRKRESAADGGYAHFSLTFVEAGQAAAPTTSTLPGVQMGTKADNAMTALGKVLNSRIRLAGVPFPVSEATLDALRTLGGGVSSVSAVLRMGADIPGALKRLASIGPADLMGLLPSELADPFFSLAGAYASLRAAFGPAHAARASALLTMAQASPTNTWGSLQAPAGAGLVRTISAENRAAVFEYQRTAAVAEAARSAALSLPASRQEATALRTQVVDAVDTVLDTSTDPDVHVAFTELRTVAVQALVEAAGSAPELAIVRNAAVLPSLLVAQHVAPGADAAAQETLLLARNSVRHPGFMPPGDLEVLRAL